MRAVSCTAPGDLVVVEREAPRPAADEVLVRIRRVGICGTDMHIFQGKHPFLEYPRVMGHELSGEVVSAPAGSPLSEGERVYINPYIACGTCHACRKGRPNCCMRIGVLGVHRDGGLAEFLALPARNVFSAEAIGLDEAAMVEFLAIGAHGVRRAEIQPGDRVLVVGAGPIGLGAMLFARLAGGEVTTLDLRADRLAFARSALGIPHTVPAGEGAASALADLTGGDFFDVVIDATGNTASIEASFAYVAHCGTYVLLSVVKDVIRFADPEFHKREMKLVASRNALAVDFETVLAAMARGDVPTGLLATHRAPLADLPARMPDWIRPETGVIKALVEV
ncbi:zinc-binding alcohol dehydrogenase family protein [Segnochrobactrum spirostomi]|uniref:Zinc-binding alcohol dehydrogenase family protein n=1 Tax=Segnochrobactrum spirostomi TaxID=2608987 RepID=A0A6A7Y973_9HYPH|nr:zinc-binding alcohol dehydrogenase family protein [Segnochrobactrum spirostomi]MQT14192.1 zinc-binding alcohol dehydrogenase family protein [Segnochrobactrum spirostomi]